ncbi:uncharacterized protein LOC141595381 [Silene latifolia]|uniref:uncharacterized protein LOC141595381 n=1 Tax=Silene latifolia TaxID=37657 RepID=UPI003D784664
MVYKLVSRVLANRLKLFLEKIVSENQSAFTPGRLISDNILITFEIFPYMKNARQMEGHMAIKLDMAKISNSAPPISHLLFADDSIFFVKATVEEADVFNGILRRYEAASGQMVNLDKTTVSFSKGVMEERRQIVAGRLGVMIVEEQAQYLGLPTVIGRSKKVRTDIIRDKLCKRLQGWRGKLLLRAGKEILIKAVANSLRTYVMSVFKILVNFFNELQSMVSRFWWGHEEGRRDLSWVSWKAKYFLNGDFMAALMGNSPSYTLRGILKARSTLERGLRRRISDGLETKIWGHAWIPGTQTGRVISPCMAVREDMCVAELFWPNDGGWDKMRLTELFLPFECDIFSTFTLAQIGQEMDGTGVLSVMGYTRFLQPIKCVGGVV